MPFLSRAQQRWGNSLAGKKALGVKGVNEWNAATKGPLPTRLGPTKTQKAMSRLKRGMAGKKR